MFPDFSHEGTSDVMRSATSPPRFSGGCPEHARGLHRIRYSPGQTVSEDDLPVPVGASHRCPSWSPWLLPKEGKGRDFHDSARPRSEYRDAIAGEWPPPKE